MVRPSDLLRCGLSSISPSLNVTTLVFDVRLQLLFDGCTSVCVGSMLQYKTSRIRFCEAPCSLACPWEHPNAFLKRFLDEKVSREVLGCGLTLRSDGSPPHGLLTKFRLVARGVSSPWDKTPLSFPQGARGATVPGLWGFDSGDFFITLLSALQSPLITTFDAGREVGDAGSSLWHGLKSRKR